MATKLSKPVTRETYLGPCAALPAGGHVLITISRGGISIREKGRRNGIGTVPLTVVASMAARVEAKEIMRARKEG